MKKIRMKLCFYVFLKQIPDLIVFLIDAVGNNTYMYEDDSKERMKEIGFKKLNTLEKIIVIVLDSIILATIGSIIASIFS